MIKSLKISIWGRDFSLPIVYDCYKGESVEQSQIDALDAFIKHSEWIDKSQKYVESFCENQVMDDPANKKKDNIFSYVIPECIFVKREKNLPRVALMCKYRYDLEHGLAVVFSSDGSIKVGLQDIIL